MFNPLDMVKAMPGGAEQLAKLTEMFKAAKALTAAVDAFNSQLGNRVEDEAKVYEANEEFKRLMSELPKIPGVTDE